MNDAGKIAFTPKGDYSSTVTYEYLDTVVYDGNAYAALKTTTGNAPEEGSEYWILLARGGTSVPVATEGTEGVVKASDDIGVDSDAKMILRTDFAPQENLTELESGESRNTFFGKIAKAVSELIRHINVKASTSATGHVKLSDSSAVTDSTGLALPATEKNAAISGTMANQISELNTNFTKGLNTKENTNAFKSYCPTFGTTYSGVIDDAFAVDTSSADGALNKVYYVTNGATRNIPNCYFGIREVYYYAASEILVKITGVNLDGYMSTWYNRYNGTTWLGWQEQITFNSNKVVTGIKRIGILPTSGQQTAIYDSDNWLVFGTGNGITSRSKDNINVYLPVSGSAFQQISSKKVKENIKDLSEDEASKILNVRAVSFDYIEKVGGEKNQRGVIAEEIEKIIPSCVYHDGDYPSVDYTKLIPYLIKIVQMQQKEIDELKQAH